MNINYQALLDQSMLELVRKVLFKASDEGLAGENHFYISFRTDHADVILSDRMKQKYPHEITIVLQNQYEKLIVLQDYFTVRLSFNGIKEIIKVPFNSLTSFVDPSVKFSLQFSPKSTNLKKIDEQIGKKIERPLKREVENLGENVIALDKFRKKNKI